MEEKKKTKQNMNIIQYMRNTSWIVFQQWEGKWNFDLGGI